MERWRSTRGQATAEYAALILLVAVALALAVGLTSGGVGGQVLAGLQRGICRVTDARCSRPEPPQADLDPCVLERTERDEQFGLTVAVVRLGTTGTLTIVRLSDGRTTVTLAHGNDLGGEVGAGLRLRLGGQSLTGDVRAGAGATWTSGRSWTFGSERAARSFVDMYGRKATIGGQLLDDVRSHCSLLCDAIGWRPHAQLPEPDEIYAEAGPAGSLTASFGLEHIGLGAEALLGRQQRRDGSRVWYVQLDAEAAAGLALPGAGLTAAAAGEAVLAYELDPQGQPRSLRVSRARELGADAALGQRTRTAHAMVAAGRAAVAELDATLDLREPANRAAAAALLSALADPGALASVSEHARELGERIARRGQIDRRTYALDSTASGLGASIALGAKLGGGVDRSARGLRLLTAETRLPGLPFLPRDDCRPT